MNKFIFISVLLILFTLELMNPIHQLVVQPFTENLASLTAFLLHLIDKDVASSGIVLTSISKGTAVAIQAGCNGIEAIICLTAAILAYQATWKEKLTGLMIGFFAIQSLNIIRIISLFYLLQWNKTWFEWAHLYAWQALIFLDVLIVFVVWIRWLSQDKTAIPSTPATLY